MPALGAPMTTKSGSMSRGARALADRARRAVPARRRRWPPAPSGTVVEPAGRRVQAPDPILVLASGQRCGSTVVQRLVSSHPDALIWGEHGGHLHSLHAVTKALEHWDRSFGPSGREGFARDAHHSFMANLVPGEEPVSAAARAYILELFANPAAALGRPRWGFKEVRYGLEEVEWLSGLFPGLRAVHVTRDPRAVLLSLDDWERSPTPWERPQTREALGDWLRINRSLLGSEHPHVRSFRYEDIVAAPDEFVPGLAGFLGLDAERIDRGVFERRVHTEGPAGRRPRTLRKFEELPDDLRALARAPEMVDIARAYGYGL